MGHYYSDMVSDDEHQKKADKKERSRLATAEQIRGAIAEHGLEYVLALIIEDPTMASIRFRRHG